MVKKDLSKIKRAVEEGLKFSHESFAFAFGTKDIMIILYLMKHLLEVLLQNSKAILENISLKEIIKANNALTEDILLNGMVEPEADVLLAKKP